MSRKRSGSLIVRDIGLLLPMRGGECAECIPCAAVAIVDGDVVFAGPERDLDRAALAGIQVVDAKGGLVTPGLVECHTHLVFAGSRADEFEARGRGLSYEEMTRRGGGILNTVRAVRDASREQLVSVSLPRVWRALAEGITTIEVKSGYGLTLESEVRMLEVVRDLDSATPSDLVPTFLGAHTFPPGVDRAAHLEAIVSEWVPAVAEAGLARFCDVFCEAVAFNRPEAERVLRAGLDHGMRPKVHAEQLSRSGGAALAADLSAVSADHLDFADARDLDALRESGTVAVLLPGCSISLGSPRFPAGRVVVDAGLRVALSTDFNPGSSVTLNLPMMGTLAMAYMGMTHMEVWAAMTTNAAAALGMADRIGSLAPGFQGDLVVFSCNGPCEPFYQYGGSLASVVVKRGIVVAERSERGEVRLAG